MDFADKATFSGPITHIINVMCLTLKYAITVTICVHNYKHSDQKLIGIHKKADLLKMKVNVTKHRKVHADKNKL